MNKRKVSINGIIQWVDNPDPSPEELVEKESQRLSDLSDFFRGIRNSELFQSDWTQVADIQGSMDGDTKSKWIIYRQSLRDLPEHANWPDLEYGDWPLDLNGNNNSGMDPP